MATKRPNIILIMTDQHRYDRLGCMGDPLIQTPHLDGLAHEGVVFDSAYTASPVCGPAQRQCNNSGKVLWQFLLRHLFGPFVASKIQEVMLGNEVFMSENIEVCFRGEYDATLSLRVLGRLFPDSTDYWDANVLKVEFTAKVSVFQGSVAYDLRVDELEKFNNELRSLYRNLTGVAVLETLDKWIRIEVEALKLGHIRVTGYVKNGVYDDNMLNFVLITDQTFLSTPLDQLKKILSEFPLIGQR